MAVALRQGKLLRGLIFLPKIGRYHLWVSSNFFRGTFGNLPSKIKDDDPIG
jgi:hypothetical protein